MLQSFLPLAIVLAILPAAANADPQTAPRYQIVAITDGVVRLDTQTGDMTHCLDTDNGFQCEVITTQEPKAALGTPDKPTAQNDDKPLKDFENALSIVEKAMKSFMTITGNADRACSL